MNLSKFLSALRTSVHELGYNVNQLDIISIYSSDDDKIQVMLADKNDEEYKLTLEDNAEVII